MSTRPRPVLQYYGGKWKLAPWIVRWMPPHRVYCEAFGGAASVLMTKPRSQHEVLNDLDREVVNVYAVLRDPGNSRLLAERLRLTPFARAELMDCYTPHEDPVEQARRTITRSYLGWPARPRSGLRAETRRRGAITPTAWPSYPESVEQFTARLSGVVIECAPALEVMRRYDGPDTLHYLDPPYLPETRSPDSPGYRHEMDHEAHRLLLLAALDLQGLILLSGYRSDLYREILGEAGWSCEIRRAYACGRHARTECLWRSPAAVEAHRKAAA